MSDRPDHHCVNCETDQSNLKRSGFIGQSCHHRELDGITLAEVRHARGREIPRHAHDLAFASVLISGRYQSRYGGTNEDFIAGRAVWHESGFDHEDVIAPGGAAFFCVQIKPERIASLADDSPDRGRSGRVDGQAAAAFLRLFVANHFDLDDLIIEANAVEAISRSVHSLTSDDHAATWARHIKSRLMDQPGHRATLAELAAIAGIHPAHLCRAFRNRFGCNIGTYAARIRLTAAWDLLCNSNESLAAIAQQLGYADQPHFTREFLRFVGITPGRARTVANS